MEMQMIRETERLFWEWKFWMWIHHSQGKPNMPLLIFINFMGLNFALFLTHISLVCMYMHVNNGIGGMC